MSSSKEYEKLAAKIYQELEPYAEVKHDDKIIGSSGVERQIDVAIRSNIAGHIILILVQAKDYNTAKVDINDVGVFLDVIRDVKAHKGVMICNFGFTEGAIKRAKESMCIDLCTLHDAQSKKWNQEFEIPVVWIERLPKLTISGLVYFHSGDSVPTKVDEWVLSNDEGKTRLLPFQTFKRVWNERKIPQTTGKTHSFQFEQKNVEILTAQKEWRPIKLSLSYFVEEKMWYKNFLPSESRGIIDYLTKETRISYLKIDDIPFSRDVSWKEIRSINLNQINSYVIITTEGSKVDNPTVTTDATFTKVD